MKIVKEGHQSCSNFNFSICNVKQKIENNFSIAPCILVASQFHVQIHYVEALILNFGHALIF